MSDPAQPAGQPSGDPADDRPYLYRYPVRRTPNVKAFLVTGALLGVLAGLLINQFGPGSHPVCPDVKSAAQACRDAAAAYQPSSGLQYLLVLGAGVGVLGAGIAAAVLDRIWSRR